MTIDSAIEVGLTSTVAATTTALAMLQVEEYGLMILVLSLGVSSIVGLGADDRARAAGTTFIALYKVNAGNWTAATNTTQVYGQITFEIT